MQVKLYSRTIVRDQVSKENDSRSTMKIQYIGLMCNECLRVTKPFREYSHIQLTNCGIQDILTYTTEYFGMCPFCGKDTAFNVIDANMAKIIDTLNLKGYFTSNCCEGHYENLIDDENDRNVAWAYIQFKDTMEDVFKEYPLPESWATKDNRNIYDALVFVNMSDFESNDKYFRYIRKKIITDRKNMLSDLLTWAYSLPWRK